MCLEIFRLVHPHMANPGSSQGYFDTRFLYIPVDLIGA